MKRIRTQVSVSGIPRAECSEGIQCLADEFAQRPWLLTAEARWDDQRSLLLVLIEREGSSLAIQGGDTGATLDEVCDCVFACFRLESGDVRFEVESSVFVEPEG